MTPVAGDNYNARCFAGVHMPNIKSADKRMRQSRRRRMRNRHYLSRMRTEIKRFRRMLEEQIRIVEDGGDPINTFRDPERNVYLGMDTEHWSKRAELGGGQAFAFERQGMASKYSPIMNQRGFEGGEDAEERNEQIRQEVAR